MNDDHVVQTIRSYDQFAREYTEKIRAFAPLTERDTFISKVKSNGDILDAGSGSGRDSAYFTSKGLAVTGVDLSKKLLAISRKQAPSARFFKQDLRKLSFKDDSFDGIWACASLLHLKRSEIPGVLRRFYKILRTGGVLFVLVKEGEGQGTEIGSTFQKYGRFFTYFHAPELRDFLKDAGFSVDEIDVWNQHDRWQERPSERWISSFSRKP